MTTDLRNLRTAYAIKLAIRCARSTELAAHVEAARVARNEAAEKHYRGEYADWRASRDALNALEDAYDREFAALMEFYAEPA